MRTYKDYLLNISKELYNRVNNAKSWQEELLVFSQSGQTHSKEVLVTPRDLAIIDKLETEGKDSDTKVIAIVKSSFLTEDMDLIELNNYILYEKEYPYPHILKCNANKPIHSVLAYVDNITHHIQEYGLIGITLNTSNNTLLRVF